MKPLELTEDQKNKLLEMCKVLFPEMFTLTIQNNGYLNYSEIGKTIDYDDKIHWFEFCMGTLAAKIDNLYFTHNKEKLESKDDNIRITAWDRRPYHDLWSGFNFGALKPKGHPVDYLYKQFKELK